MHPEIGKRFKQRRVPPSMAKKNIAIMGVAAVAIVVCLLWSWLYM